MQQDAWRTYLELALGLTERPRKRAKQAIDSLTAQSGASVEQLRSMTEELVQTSLSNRESILRLVRTELERALGAVGLVNAEHLAELRTQVAELQERLSRIEAGTAGAQRSATSTGSAAKKSAAKKPAPARSTAKKSAVKKSAAKKTTSSSAAQKSAAKKAGAKTAAAKKSPAKKSGAGSTGGRAGR